MSASRIPAYLSILIAAAVSATLLHGCADIRKLTYPGNITYIDKSHVTGAMRQMSDAVTRLETLIEKAPDSQAIDQKAVVNELSILEKLAGTLQVKHGYSNDRVIDEHISSFLDDITLAREQAEHTPPNYYLAGHIAGSCAACHKFR